MRRRVGISDNNTDEESSCPDRVINSDENVTIKGREDKILSKVAKEMTTSKQR